MKRIELIKTDCKIKIDDTIITEPNYSHLIEYCIKQPIPRGFTINDIRSRSRILDALDLARKNKENFLQLEDDDFIKMKTYLKEARFINFNKSLIKFFDYIEGIK